MVIVQFGMAIAVPIPFDEFVTNLQGPLEVALADMSGVDPDNVWISNITVSNTSFRVLIDALLI